MLEQLLISFWAGNTAILTNVCMLPLYPGLIAFLAGNVQNERARAATRWMGVLVLAGVLTMMFVLSLIMYLLNVLVGNVLIWLLPIIYVIVIAFGVMLLLGRNPFARFSTGQAPVLKNPYATAYVYGLLLGPMTLPCTGPFIIGTVFTLGAASAGDFVFGVANFLAFGLGFGWPLVVLPLIAAPVQRRVIGWLTRNHSLLTRVSGILLVGVGVFGLIADWLPPASSFTFEPGEAFTTIYWLSVIALIVLMIYLGLRTTSRKNQQA